MNKKTTLQHILALSFLSVLLFSCSDDNVLIQDPFVVAFESLSKNLLEIDNEQTIDLVYSEAAYESGSVSIRINNTNAVYGTDYLTFPEAIDGIISLTINPGDTTASFVFNKLNPFLDETTKIQFDINAINHSNANIQGNSSFMLSATASLGGSMQPNVGGPNEGNQVFIDLSSEKTTAVQRDTWDLAFYSGDHFRVAINGSIYMATAALDATDIDAVSIDDVSELQNQVAVGTFDPNNAAYVDAPNGNILETAISEINDNDSQNKVYLVNMGYSISNTIPTPGSTAIIGAHRGWKKIRILKNENGYILQYADIDSNTHQEISIEKNSNYNFSFFSFNTQSIVTVEPEKDRWDLSFTVFTNIIENAGSYGYSDFVTHNRKGGTTAYMVETSNYNYDDFSLSHVDPSLFTEDQTVIGDHWRDVFSGTVFSDRFFVLKDPNGNYYKIRFLALTSPNGERGYPEFEYHLLQ